MTRMKVKQKKRRGQVRKYERLIIVEAIVCVTLLEIVALLTNPSLAVVGLVATIIGGLTGYWLGGKKGILIPEYRLALGFGLIFVGLGLILQQYLQLGITWQLLEVRETYFGMLLIIFGVLIAPTQMEYKILTRRKKS